MILEFKVKPNSPGFKIKRRNGEILICCKSLPEDNKANKEIVKRLSKLTKKKVEIVRGLTSKKKTILIDDMTEEEFNELIS